ncbi:MAG: Asp-tRNA(Asn)/Glu-tRNA(Gln) amidotransferase subunit GatC, partial [Dehalococcoidales bacterium]
SKLGLTEDEVEKMSEQLSNILENFEILNKVDTDGVPPTAQPNALTNVLKDDVVKPSLPQDEVLANAPQRDGDYIRVKVVLE